MICSSALAVDWEWRVFVTGYSTGIGSSEDYATIGYANSEFIYTPTNGFTGMDTFTHVMQDGYGLTYTGTVSVAVGVVANTISTEVLPSGEVQLGFYGTPGQPYALERIFDLTSNVWPPQQTSTAAANGSLSFTNLPAAPPTSGASARCRKAEMERGNYSASSHGEREAE